MEQMEKVEFIREKAQCTYSEAKTALEEANGDLLEALCWLEAHGKTQLAGAASSTEDREAPKTEAEPEYQNAPHGDGPFARGCRSLWDGLMELLHKGNTNQLVMTNRDGKREFGMPVTLFVILLLAAFWVVLPLMIVALFFGNRFSFLGPDLGRDDINGAMGKATDFAESVKQEFTEKK